MPLLSRSRRFHSGGTYHVISRGNNGIQVFLDDEDRQKYLSLLWEKAERAGFSVHHYVLMGNHVHFIVALGEPVDFSREYGRMQQEYSMYHARKYGRTGHLWESRFTSYSIETDEYLLTCGIYIALNPVRAGMIKSAGDYRWSSVNSYMTDRLGQGVTMDPAYKGLAPTPHARQAAYRALLQMWQNNPVPKQKAKKFFKYPTPNTLHPFR